MTCPRSLAGYDEGVTESRRRIPGWLPQVLGYSLSAGCLIWVLHGYPLNELGPTLRSLDYRWVALAVVVDLLVYVVHGWRWTTLLIPVARVNFWRTVQAVYIGLFANEVLPLRTGEVIRCYLLAHWSDLRLSLTFASAGVERIIDGVWIVVAFLITATFVRGIPHDLTLLVQLLGVLLLAGVGLLAWVVMHKQHAHAVLSESRWSATLRHIVEGLHLMGRPRSLGLTALISVLYLALQMLSVFALMRAYGLDLSIWAAAGILTLVRISTVVPNAPGNLGLINLACVMAMGLFEVEKNDAKTFSIILFVSLTLPLLIGGAIATALTGVNIGELRDRAHQGARQAGK
jgi:glycosyltransferase 2 family protein